MPWSCVKCDQMFQFPRQSWLHNGLHRTQASSSPRQTLLASGFFLTKFPLTFSFSHLPSPHNPGSSQLPQWWSWNFKPFQCKGMGQSFPGFLDHLWEDQGDLLTLTPGLPIAQRSVSVLPLLLLMTVQVPARASLRPWSLQKHIKSFTHSLTFLHPLQIGIFGVCLQVCVCILTSWSVAPRLEGAYQTKITCLVSFQMKTGRKHSTEVFT